MKPENHNQITALATAFSLAFSAVIALILTGCGKAATTAPSPSSQAATTDTGGNTGVDDKTKTQMPVIGSLLNATLGITVDVNTKQVCTGSIDISLNTQASDSADLLSLQNLQVKCIASTITDPIIQKIDFQNILAPLRGIQINHKMVEIKDNILAMARVNNSVFTPSRPMLPLFFSMTNDQLKAMGVRRDHIQFTNVKTNEQGEFDNEVEVTAVDEPITSSSLNHTFTHTLRAQIRAQNQTTTHALTDMVPDVMELVLSVSPIVILNFNLEARIDKLVGEVAAVSSNPDSTWMKIFNGIADAAVVKQMMSKFTLKISAEVQTMTGVDQNILDGPTKRDTADAISAGGTVQPLPAMTSQKYGTPQQ